MKVTQPSPDELIMSDFPIFTGGASAEGFVSYMSLFIYRLTAHENRFGETYGPLLGALLGGLGAWYFFRKTVVNFDRRIGLASWKRWTVGGTTSGDIPLADIKDVIVELLAGNRGTTYRIALVTSTGRWPLTDYYVGNSYTCEKVRNALTAFLSLPPKSEAVSLEENLRYLVSSGRKVDAIKLARYQRKMSLTEAENLIQELSVEGGDTTHHLT
jgi:hypothetical protein